MSQYDYTMLKLAKMVSEIIARRQKNLKIEGYVRFMKSETRKMLFNESTDMWHNGPDYIAEEYLRLTKAHTVCKGFFASVLCCLRSP